MIFYFQMENKLLAWTGKYRRPIAVFEVSLGVFVNDSNNVQCEGFDNLVIVGLIY